MELLTYNFIYLKIGRKFGTSQTLFHLLSSSQCLVWQAVLIVIQPLASLLLSAMGQGKSALWAVRVFLETIPSPGQLVSLDSTCKCL